MTDYRTLDELMTGKAPGEIVVENKHGGTFTPFYRASGDFWFGLKNDGRSDCYPSGVDIWRPHVPPPKKVKRWQWACRLSGVWREEDSFHTEEEAKRFLDNNPERRKLPWTEMEFEEEGK